MNEERRIGGVVLVPDEPDAQGDTISAKEIGRAVEDYKVTRRQVQDAALKLGIGRGE